jgi:hypothetical protein
VFVYEHDRPGGELKVRWQVWSDGHATLGTESQRRPAVANLTAGGLEAEQEILALAKELRPEGGGAVPAMANSAVPRRDALLGTGTRQATDADRARLFALASRLATTDEP